MLAAGFAAAGRAGAMKAVFEKLLKRGDLTRDEAASVMETIAVGKAEPVQVRRRGAGRGPALARAALAH